MTKQYQSPSSTQRRDFLRNSVFATAGVAAAALSAEQASAASDTPTTEAPSGETLGYQETQHIRDYYRTASF